MVVGNNIPGLRERENRNYIHQHKGAHVLNDLDDRAHEVADICEHAQVVQ